MSREIAIRTALYTAFSGITYNSLPVKFYDMVRDDISSPHIYSAGIILNYDGTKSKDVWDGMLMIGVKETMDGTYTGKKAVDTIGEEVETILQTPLSISGYTVIIQQLERSYYAEKADKSVKDIIKMYIYKIMIE